MLNSFLEDEWAVRGRLFDLGNGGGQDVTVALVFAFLEDAK